VERGTSLSARDEDEEERARERERERACSGTDLATRAGQHAKGRGGGWGVRGVEAHTEWCRSLDLVDPSSASNQSLRGIAPDIQTVTTHVMLLDKHAPFPERLALWVVVVVGWWQRRVGIRMWGCGVGGRGGRTVRF
jgi:hypothetical protein